MREKQTVSIVPLEAQHTAYADMQTTIFIGNSSTHTFMDFMFTPRDYVGKYDREKLYRSPIQEWKSQWDTACLDIPVSGIPTFPAKPFHASRPKTVVCFGN